MKSEVASIEPLNSFDKEFEIGVPLSTQPQVQIYDFNGKTLEGKIATIFSWIEPEIGQDEGVPVYISNRKFFALSGEVSDESDIDGIATFSDFTIIGA